MDPHDLLYTNEFRKIESLSKRELEENANNFIPYRTLKANSVNNVRDTLERTSFTNNPIVDRENKGYGWKKGGMGNQIPMLSDFGQDLAEQSYRRYKTHYLNIDSRMRDVALYPKPNNYKMFLGRRYNNIELIKVVDYFFPDAPYAINASNNNLMWFVIPNEMLNKDLSISSLFTGNLNIVQFDASFNRLIDLSSPDCKFLIDKFRNNVLKCLYAATIPPGNYTTRELERAIERVWRSQLFFDSDLFPDYINVPYDADPTSITLQLADRPQLVKVRIDPITSGVDFLLRYEELRIDYMKSYVGKNYVDIRLKTEDPLVASEEYNVLANNTFYPLVGTGFPGIGGLDENFFNYNEFVPKNIFEYFVTNKDQYKAYYDIVIDPNTGMPILNVLRLYFYIIYGSEIKASSTEVYKFDDKCPSLCDCLIGREAPFFLIKGSSSPLFTFIQQVNNSSFIFVPNPCSECATDFLNEIDNCKVIPQDYEGIINEYICNLDGSIKLITNLLGFFDTNNALAQIGPASFAFGITVNIIYKTNNYFSTIQSFTITGLGESKRYQECRIAKEGLCNNNNFVELAYQSDTNSMDFKLPVCKNQDGTYSFYTENYMFLKLLNPVFANQLTGSQIVQVRSSSTFSNGSNDKYYYRNSEIRGITIPETKLQKGIDPLPVKGEPCYNELPSIYPNKTSGVLEVSKDVENLFAKIKFSSISGSCVVDNYFTNEVIYFEGNVGNLDEFTVQLVDYEGKILEIVKDHCFTLMMVEKIEILRETGLHSKTGYVNMTNTEKVQRNSFNN